MCLLAKESQRELQVERSEGEGPPWRHHPMTSCHGARGASYLHTLRSHDVVEGRPLGAMAD